MKRFLLPATALLALAPFAAAQEGAEVKSSLPPEVKVWVDKIDEMVGKPAEYDMSMVMDMEAQGQAMKLNSTGHILMLDQEHMRATMTMNIEMEIMPPMEMKLLTVIDGKTMWIESENPMMGKQIMKADVSMIQKLKETGASMSPGGNVNQLEQIRDLFENYYENFQVEVGEKHVTITGDISNDISEMGDFAEMGLAKFRMVLDAKTGFPVETVMNDGKKDVMVIKLENLKFPKKEDLPKDAFVYEPPEGAAVMDIGALMGGGMGDAEADF